MTGAERNQRIADHCWNMLGTVDPDEVLTHLKQYLWRSRPIPAGGYEAIPQDSQAPAMTP